MDSNYHIFKKSVQSKGKTVHKWYCYWNDPVTGVMHQKVCKGCKTQAEAYAFVSALPPLFVEEKVTIGKIGKWMYIPGSTHLERMEKLGKQYTLETLKCKRGLLDIFLAKFGDLELKDLTIPMVIDFLTEDPHSGSWKNNFLTVVGEVYAEAPFMGLPYIPAPQFPKFRRNSIKKDVFTTDELNILFDESLWINLSSTKYANHPQFDEGHKAIYMMFLCCIKCGLRIGEAIVNSIMHRSYRMNRPTQIIRYNNRIEIINAGFSLKDQEFIGNAGSYTRNYHLATIFHETNLAETKGTGIRTIRQLLSESKMPLPTFESNRKDDSFTIRLMVKPFYREEDIKWLKLFDKYNFNKNQKEALIFAREVGAVDTLTYSQMNLVSSSIASEELIDMEKTGLLIKKGRTEDVAYYTLNEISQVNLPSKNETSQVNLPSKYSRRAAN